MEVIDKQLNEEKQAKKEEAEDKKYTTLEGISRFLDAIYKSSVLNINDIMKQEITRYIKNFKILENDFNLESSNIDGLVVIKNGKIKWYDGIMENKLYKQAVKTTANFLFE